MKPHEVVPDELDISKDRQLFPGDLTTRDVRPETIMAALMQAAPGDGYQDSLEDSEVLIASIAYAMECLSQEDIYCLNAIQHEGITYEELSKRLGVSKTQGWRLHKRTIERLRTLLLNHNPVRERLGMKQTWNAAAMKELISIAGYDESPLSEPQDVVSASGYVSAYIHNAVGAIDGGREFTAVNLLTTAAQFAVHYLRSINQWSLLDMHTLLCSKQSDYGHGNIQRFGMFGVMVRASDKAERLKNLTKSVTQRDGITPANESLIDTFLDVIGYAVIARMLKAETFELQLEPTESGTT